MDIYEELSPYFFEVELVDFYTLTGKNAFKPVAVFRKDQNKILHLASKDYKLISNFSITKPILDSLIAKNYELKAASFSEGEKYYIKLIVTSKPLEINAENTIYPCVEIANSYDGTLMATVNLGFYHLQESTSLLGLSLPFLNHKKHKEELLNETLFNYEVISMFISYFSSQKEKFTKLLNIKILETEINEKLKILIKKSGLPAIFGQLILHELKASGRSSTSAWEIYMNFIKILNTKQLKMPYNQKLRIIKIVLNELQLQ